MDNIAERSRRSAFFVRRTSIDLAGWTTVQEEPDPTGQAYQFRDYAGRVRFSRKNVSFSEGCFKYFKYDSIGRLAETGVLRDDQIHEESAYLAMANDPSYPSHDQALWTKRYYYDYLTKSDGELDSGNLKGRLLKVEANDNPVYPVAGGARCYQKTGEGATTNAYQYRAIA